MVFVKGSCFEMGDVFSDHPLDSEAEHTVCVDDFYIGAYEVTVGEFAGFVGKTGYITEAEQQDGCHSWEGQREIKKKEFSWKNPGFKQSSNDPVVCVSWNDADRYIKWLNNKTEVKYRLPTEAEWEYAARSGGKRFMYSWGAGEKSDNVADRNAMVNLLGSDSLKMYDDGYTFTSPAGSFSPNGLGIYDMSGNVYEWVSDWYGADYYKVSPKENPKGPSKGIYKVLRGGSWNPLPELVKTTDRRRQVPGGRGAWMGFRLVYTAS